MGLFGKPKAGGFMDEIRCDEQSYLNGSGVRQARRLTITAVKMQYAGAHHFV